jgi:lysophospholipase L1-like esterase
MNFKYYIGALLTIPLLPLIYYQGKKIRVNVPKLPEAKGAEGSVNSYKNQGTIRLVTLGESTIAGVGVQTHEEGFTRTLAEELSNLFHSNVDWQVYARSGYTAKNISEKLVPKIKEQHIDIIAIGIGGNDAFKLNSPTKWRKAIRSLIENLRLKYPNTIIVFCNMPPIKEFPAFTSLIKATIGNLVEVLGEELKKVVVEYDHVYYFGEVITLKDWIKRLNIDVKKEEFFSDGVHPSKLTYQTWAKDIALKIFQNDAIKKGLALSNNEY